jgi:hypothetical protein
VLLPTVESRIGLFLFKLKEFFSMMLYQLRHIPNPFFDPNDPIPIKSFPVKYLGNCEAEVYFLNKEERLKIERSNKIKKLICQQRNGEQLSFIATIVRQTNLGVIVSFRCFSRLKKEIISDPENEWFFC